MELRSNATLKRVRHCLALQLVIVESNSGKKHIWRDANLQLSGIFSPHVSMREHEGDGEADFAINEHTNMLRLEFDIKEPDRKRAQANNGDKDIMNSPEPDTCEAVR